MKIPTQLTYDRAYYILKHTNDGDDLSRRDLALVAIVVNGSLSADDEKEFFELYENIKQ